MQFGVRGEGEAAERRAVLVGGRDGDLLLAGQAEQEPLARRRDAGDGLELGLELGHGPRRRNAALRAAAVRRDLEGHVRQSLQAHGAGVGGRRRATAGDGGRRQGCEAVVSAEPMPEGELPVVLEPVMLLMLLMLVPAVLVLVVLVLAPSMLVLLVW